jgi:hypothetical protein
VEKYDVQKHRRKFRLFEQHLSASQRNLLTRIRQDFGVQLPDLFVIGASGDCWFAEVKGPGDRLSELQQRSHEAIASKLGIPVRLINVRIDEGTRFQGKPRSGRMLLLPSHALAMTGVFCTQVRAP